MQTTFNLNSCIYVHLPNVMQWKAQIVAFGAILSRYEIC